MIKNMLKDQKGQGLVEYGLIIVGVAVAVVAAMTAFGNQIRTFFNNLQGQLGF